MMLVRIRNRGKVERGPFSVKYTAPPQTAAKIVRPGKPDSAAEIGRGRFLPSITFGAAGSATDTIEVDERDLGDTPLGRAVKSRTDTLVIVK